MYTTRTFVAIEVGPQAVAALIRLQKQLEGQVADLRWIPADQMHVTIKFLGDVDNRDLPKICEELHRACQGLEPFDASMRGLGTFPRNKPPRLLWAGMDEGCQELIGIHQHLDHSLAEIGIPREGRAFTPHLTLGRVGRNTQLETLAGLVADASPGINARFEVDEVHLMASIRERGKIVHEPIETVVL